MLALGGRLNAATQTAACRCADRGPLAAAGDGADDGSNARSRAYLRGCILAARRALPPVLIGLQAVVFASRRDAIQLQSHH